MDQQAERDAPERNLEVSPHRTVIKHKVDLLRLAQELGNVSQDLQGQGLLPGHVLPVPAGGRGGGVEALVEKPRRKPNLQ